MFKLASKALHCSSLLQRHFIVQALFKEAVLWTQNYVNLEFSLSGPHSCQPRIWTPSQHRILSGSINLRTICGDYAKEHWLPSLEQPLLHNTLSAAYRRSQHEADHNTKPDTTHCSDHTCGAATNKLQTVLMLSCNRQLSKCGNTKLQRTSCKVW